MSRGTDRPALDALLARHGATLDRWLPRLGLALINIPVGREAAAAEALSAEPLVDFATEHRRSVRVADTPLDQYFSQQWGMAKVEGPAAWDIAWGDPATLIAVIDTGVNYLHQDLRKQYWINPGESYIDPVTGVRFCDNNGADDDGNGYYDDCRGWNFAAPAGPNVDDDHGHGTVVAGVAVAATNNYEPIIANYAGVAGMARSSRVMILKALDRYGEGWPFDIATAIDYAVAQGAQVINLSLTLPPANPAPGDVAILQRPVADALAAGVLVVGATGNQNYNGVAYPAAFPGVLAVGASTPADVRAAFSNYGSRLDLVAPGAGILSTLRQPGYNTYGLYDGSGNGTSFAAPHVAGVAALVRSLRPGLGQAAAAELVVQSVDDVGVPGRDAQTGWGRLNAWRAVYSATLGLTLTLTVDPPTIAPGRPSTLTVQVMTSAGAHAGAPATIPAGLGGRVAFTSTQGAFAPAIVTADGQGRAATRFAASPGLEAVEVTASLGGVSVTLPISVTSGLPAALTVTAAPPRIASAGGQSIVMASVVDEGGSPVVDGITVTFTTTLGAVAPAQTVTLGGKATTILTSDVLTGTASVLASAERITGTTSVEIVGAGEPFRIELSAAPGSLAVAGAPATVTAVVLDAFDAPVPDGATVHFATDLGVVAPPDATTSGGRASAQLQPGTQAGMAHVTAQVGGAHGALAVPIVAGQAMTVTLDASPDSLVAGAYPSSSVTLTVTATDLYGNTVVDGTPVVLAASLGRVTPASGVTLNGRNQARFDEEQIAGTARITATVGAAQGFALVRIRPAEPYALLLSAHPITIPVGGEAATLTAIVRDRYANRVEGALRSR